MLVGVLGWVCWGGGGCVLGDVGGWVTEFWTSGIVYSYCEYSVLNSIWPKNGLNEFWKSAVKLLWLPDLLKKKKKHIKKNKTKPNKKKNKKQQSMKTFKKTRFQICYGWTAPQTKFEHVWWKWYMHPEVNCLRNINITLKF